MAKSRCEDAFAFVQQSQLLAGSWASADAIARCRGLWDCLLACPPTSAGLDRQWIASIVVRVAARVISRCRWRREDDERVSTCDVVEQAMDFVLQHYRCHGLCLQAVADHVSLSRFHLSRLLCDQTGYGLPVHVSGLRALAATLILRTTTIPAKEVAYLVGFVATTELDRQFRHWYKMTPTDFRTEVSKSPTSPLTSGSWKARLTLQSVAAMADSLSVDFATMLGAACAAGERVDEECGRLVGLVKNPAPSLYRAAHP